MLTRLNRHRLGLLILTILSTITFFLNLISSDISELKTGIFGQYDSLIGYGISFLSSFIIGAILSFIAVAFTGTFTWTFAMFFVCAIPLTMIYILFPALNDHPIFGMSAMLWIMTWIGVILLGKFLALPKIARKYRRDLAFNGVFNVNLSPEELWKMLTPLPENQKTLFSPTTSGIEPIETDRHLYKIYSSISGEQEPTRMLFSKLIENREFTTQSATTNRYGMEIKVIENYRFEIVGDTTDIFVSEFHQGLPLIDWIYNKFNASQGDYFDGFVAYCNGKRDYSMRGIARQKRALEKP